MPNWCNGRADGWEALVDRWLGYDEKFAATSSINSSNRGNLGTHFQGSRSDDRYNKHVVYTLNILLSFPVMFLFMNNFCLALQEKLEGHPVG